MRGMMRFGLVGLGVALTTPVLAEESQKGMPQLDFGNPLLISQVVWGAIIFVVFYILASRWALPMMGGVLAHRAEVIRGDLETAQRAKTQADQAIAQLNEARRRASAQAASAIGEASAQAKRHAASVAAEVNGRLDAQLAEAEGRIAAAREAAMGALREVATETAETVVARLTGRAADRAAVDAAVGQALAARAA